MVMMASYNFSFHYRLLQLLQQFFPLDLTPNFLQMSRFTKLKYKCCIYSQKREPQLRQLYKGAQAPLQQYCQEKLEKISAGFCEKLVEGYLKRLSIG